MYFAGDEEKNSEHAYVITYKELVFTFAIFTLILFVLYPKDLLKEQVVSEKANYDLSVLYLKNLLKHDPSNEKLMLALAKKAMEGGKKDLALRLLALLLHSKNQKFQFEATLLSYKIAKEDYFYFKTTAAKQRQKEKLLTLFLNIVNQKMYKAKDLKKWYGEAQFLNADIIAYNFLKELYKKEPENIKYLTQLYYFSLKYKKNKEAMAYLDTLLLKDKKHYFKWLKQKYYILLDAKRYKDVEKLLISAAHKESTFKELLATFYIMQKEYIKSSNVYQGLCKNATEYTKKKLFFKKAVSALQGGRHLTRAAHLARRYENYFINDKSMRTYLLKLYLATGKLDYAYSYAKKIMNTKMH